MTDEKITPGKWVVGVNVIDIGEIRVQRGLTRRDPKCCSHRQLIYDSVERRVWCENCEKDVDPFTAFEGVVNQFHAWERNHKNNVEQFNELQKKEIHRIGAANLQTEWLKRNTVPCCPHCDTGLLADDFKGRIKRKSKDLELARRNSKKPE